jgi:hypothetical protein
MWSQLRGLGYRHSKRKWFVDFISGFEWSAGLSRFVHKIRILDKRRDRYDETVIDPATGQVLHDAHERLTEHTGHGSARNRDKAEGKP